MTATTQKVIEAVLSTDGSITSDQRNAALAVLDGRIPRHWPPLRELLEASPASCKFSPAPPAAPKKYLRRHEAAKHVGCSVRLIDLLKHNGDLPFHRLGRRLIVFKVDDLERLMSNHRVDASAHAE